MRPWPYRAAENALTVMPDLVRLAEVDHPVENLDVLARRIGREFKTASEWNETVMDSDIDGFLQINLMVT